MSAAVPVLTALLLIAFAGVLLQRYSPAFALLLSLGAAVWLLLRLAQPLRGVLQAMVRLGQRTNAQADNPVESAKKIRLRMDEEYDEMTTYAFAQSVVKPTATTATFINRLNTLIDETNALYNQRIAQARAAAAKKQADSESPSEI